MEPQTIPQILFWLSLSGLFYIYIGYPVLIRLLSRLRPATVDRQPLHQQVSVVIACHNDARGVTNKLASLLGSLQSELIGEILIGSDGSTDNIREAINALEDERLHLFEFAERRGKASVLNDLVPRCTHDIVVLCDARQVLSENAIGELLSNFHDPRVGVVSGELMFREAACNTTARRGIGAYWRYEKSIRRAEAKFRSVPGATGALYAIRRNLFRPIPASTLLDDVVIPMQAVTQGYRCVFEASAIAWDDPSSSVACETIRKRRTIAGAAQLAIHHPQWLLPWRNPVWLEFVSHKIIRLFSPPLLVSLLAANILLARQPLYFALLIGHGLFYVSALSGWLCQRHNRPSKLLGLPLLFVALNITTVLALWDALHGRFKVTWTRTAATHHPVITT